MKRLTYLSVHEPECSSSLFFCQAFFDEVLDDLLGHTNSGTACSHKYCSLILNRNTALLQCIDDTSEDDSPGSLNIVVEHRVLMLISLKGGEWVLEILELDDDTIRVS